jgi:hypothetical protein
MPAYLPIPEGFEVPEGETFDVLTTYTVEDGQLYPLAVDGIPFPSPEEGEDTEAEDMEGEAEAEDMEGGGFMVAIEKAMGQGKR